MVQEAVYFGENGIIKGVFHKNKRPIDINEVNIEELPYPIKDHIVRIHSNSLLKTNMELMLFHHHCLQGFLK